MRVLMLGWEFPPFIAGGLGTACYGLTRALDRLGTEILFVLPKAAPDSHSSHVRLLGPHTLDQARADIDTTRSTALGASALDEGEHADPGSLLAIGDRTRIEGFEHVVFHSLPARFASPYASPGEPGPAGASSRTVRELIERARRGDEAARQAIEQLAAGCWQVGGDEVFGDEAIEDIAPESDTGYGTDLIGDAHRYARLVTALAKRERFDVIHAHDWLTYPAGMAVSALTGVPLVVQVHATEFDRSGASVNQSVYEIERAGMHAADAVIAVSQLTRSICVTRYGVPADRVSVVYNGVDRSEDQPDAGVQIRSKDKIVLFLGRITMQKGPEYFIQAAKRVLEKIEDVKFVVAGSGDMAVRMIEAAAASGIGHKVLFTGFLRGRDVQRVFEMADCYVMPSVSEPFGIAALEAMQHDTPVIISKQSGVSEVLTHALKVDFWDTDEMANKIVAVLRHPPLGQTLRRHGAFELRGLTWDGAAQRCERIYERLVSTAASA